MMPTPVEVEAARKLAAALLESALAVQAGGRVRWPGSAPTPVQGQPSTEQKKGLLTVRDAAAFLSISPRTLFEHSAPRGSIPLVRIGNRVLYAVEDLELAIKRHKVRVRE